MVTSRRFTWVLAGVLPMALAAVGCFAESGASGEPELEVGSEAHALTAEQLTCEGYDATVADKLAKAGLKRDGNSSQHACYKYVKNHIAAGTGKAVPQTLYSTEYGASAYQFANWARNNPNDLASLGFKEVTLGKDELAPKGAIIVWARGQCGYSAVHGHIEVVVDDGARACSDFCGKIPTDCGAPSVFIPVTPSPAAAAPAAGAKCTAPAKDGGADAARDSATDSGKDAAGDAPHKDSCAGKSDGWFCSEVVTYSAYQCKGQQIALGYQCSAGKTCASSGPSRAAVLQNNLPACN